MPLFLLKSLLSLFMVGGAVVAMFTMFEIFGRSPQRFDANLLKSVHRINGRVFFLLFLLLTYFCVDFIIDTKGELSSRATFHSVFSLALLVLFLLKISFVKIYRQFYGHVQVLGILVALITFGMVGTSGFYYLMVTEFGTLRTPLTVAELGSKNPLPDRGTDGEKYAIEIREDAKSISRGKNLFEKHCSYCHETKSTRTVMGPGLVHILKNPVLPVSKRPATPENVKRQLLNPYERMPSFEYLEESEITDIVSYLNTL